MRGFWRTWIAPVGWRLDGLYRGLSDPSLIADLDALEVFAAGDWNEIEAACALARRIRGFLALRDRWLDGLTIQAMGRALDARLDVISLRLDQAIEQICAREPGHAYARRMARVYPGGGMANLEACRRRLEHGDAAGLDRAAFVALAAASLDARPQTLAEVRALSAVRLPPILDRLAGLPEALHAKMNWMEAVRAGLRALRTFSPETERAGRQALHQGRVRVTGAGQTGFTLALGHGVSGEDVFVSVPWRGTVASARTLAHELGHLAHLERAAPQGMLLAQSGLALAEAAAFVTEDLAGLARGPRDLVRALSPFVEADRLAQTMMGVEPIAPGPEIASRQDEGAGPRARILRSGISALSYPLGLALALHVRRTRQHAAFCAVMSAGGTIGYEQALADLGAPSPLALFGAMYDEIEERVAAETGPEPGQDVTHA